MVIGAKLKLYGVVAGIFVLGASAGGAAGYAMASRRLAEVLGDDRPDMRDARRFEALSRELDLTGEQRDMVHSIMERHRGETRAKTRAMLERCGGDLEGLRARVDSEIRGALTAPQLKRFEELMEKRKRRFPLGRPGSRPRKGD